MNSRTRLATVLAATGIVAVGAAGAAANGATERHRSADRFTATLTGFEEVPAISSRASGTFSARLVEDGFRWTLRYAGFAEGQVTQAHIHFGQKGVAGGVSVFLCSNLPNAPEGVRNCPDEGGTVRGTATAANVVGPANQGIAAGQLGELRRAMRAGVTYVNVHSVTYPPGEIRGQLKPRHRRR